MHFTQFRALGVSGGKLHPRIVGGASGVVIDPNRRYTCQSNRQLKDTQIMPYAYSMRRLIAYAFCMLPLAAAVSCGGDSTESMMTSAKAYMAKKDNKAAIIQIKNALQKNPELAEARYLLGKALLDSGDVVAAELELRKAQGAQFAADQVAPALARSMLLQGQFKKVVDEFGATKLVAAEAKSDLAVSVGAAQAALGDRVAADASISGAVAAAPNFAPALLAQARMKAGTGDLEGALVLVGKLLAAHANDHEGWKLKGDLLAARGNRDDALAAYRKSVEVKSDFMSGHAAIVTALLQGGKPDEAGTALEQMKKIGPKHPLTVYLSAQYAYEKKDYKAARELIDQVTKDGSKNAAALQLAGAIEYQLKSFTRAEDYFLKVLQIAPDSALARRLLVLSYLQRGQPAKAMANLEPVLGKIERDANMLALAGEVFLQNGNAAKAEEYFGKATKLDPNDAAKATSLALLHVAAGNVDGGSAELEKIAASDKGTAANMALISTYLRRNEFDKALKAIDALDKKQPNTPATLNLRGRTLLAKRDNAGARQSFERALQIEPAYLPAAISLAGLDVADKNVAQAKKRFESVIAADPKNAGAMLATAELVARTGGTPQEALDWINKAVSATPTDSAARLALIDHYLRNKDAKKASAVAQEALAAFPDRPEILDALGRAQAAAGEVNQSLATYGKLTTQQPDSPLPYMRMAEVQANNDQRDAAVQSLQRALKIRPDLIDAQRGLVTLFVGLNKQDDAIAVARDVQKQRPKEAIGFVLEGDVHAAKSNWTQAVPSYRTAFKQTPVPQLLVKLYSALLAVPSKAEADALAQTWIKEHPKDVEVRMHLGDRANFAKDYATALNYYRVALEQQPNNPVILNNMAWVLGQTKSPKALEYAENANRLAPEQPPFMDTLGMLLADAGDATRSLDLLERAVKLAPQAASIRLNYARLLIKSGKKPEARKELDELAKLGEKFNQQAEVKQLLGAL